MKLLVFCNSDVLALPVIHRLLQKEQLAGIAIIETYAPHLQNVFKQHGIPENLVYVLNTNHWSNHAANIIRETQAHAVLMITFPWKIPVSLLELPPFGWLNMHFGLLPEYSGADPIFWHLKNNTKEGGITIHQVNDKIDAGNILHIARLPITLNDNYGLYSIKLGMLSVSLVDILPELLKQEGIPQERNGVKYMLNPTVTDLTINWNEQSVEDILCLVNATNPKYHGAITFFRNMPIRILEVIPVDMVFNQAYTPGAIVISNSEREVIVACINEQYLKITVVQTKEGYLSGAKMANMGLRTGERFQ